MYYFICPASYIGREVSNGMNRTVAENPAVCEYTLKVVIWRKHYLGLFITL